MISKLIIKYRKSIDLFNPICLPIKMLLMAVLLSWKKVDVCSGVVYNENQMSSIILHEVLLYKGRSKVKQIYYVFREADVVCMFIEKTYEWFQCSKTGNVYYGLL